MEPNGAFELVNDEIRRLATAESASESWEFFCECDDAGCRELVTLTLHEFDRHRAASPPVPVLAHRA